MACATAAAWTRTVASAGSAPGQTRRPENIVSGEYSLTNECCLALLGAQEVTIFVLTLLGRTLTPYIRLVFRLP